MPSIEHSIEITQEYDGMRLDQAVSSMLKDYSRSQITNWIKTNKVTVDGTVITKPRTKVQEGQTINLSTELETKHNWYAQQGPELDIIYDDDDLLIVNKKVGMVVHPGAGNPDNTLINYLLSLYPQLQQLPRCGVIHRLDKDTTGLLVVAKSQLAHHKLSETLLLRDMKRTYLAICKGHFVTGGSIDEPIGRHPRSRIQMAVNPSGRAAKTHYDILKRFGAYTLLEVRLETGRTHQIRVHMNHINHPIVGDPVYGKHQALAKGIPAELKQALSQFKRQALHAYKLAFEHPRTGEPLAFCAPIPNDMQKLLDTLDEYNKPTHDYE